ncbi:hypothetical protein [Pallidibacillus pasinlerensis]|uniref:Uncharacterized protein n=1 Tax=Pallidibacillus pasinlerensis TaxID=2703818 RepID=A0ABW9ZYV5_9BACI|nr:hypothetical protein [Pallidibacillus pasinlerensis]NCU16353.1 hypothetical protein [Pallidibacillus pasinlerensis]
MNNQDQAEKLREVVKNETIDEIDFTSNLPLRSEYHKRKNKKKKKSKIKYPIIKLLVILFLMLPVIIGIFYFYHLFNADSNPVFKNQKNDYFDQVEFE